jgi:hypothetical protein
MRMNTPHRHRLGLAAPYLLRPSTLITFEGAPRSGRTTQFERLRRAQVQPAGPTPLFAQDPMFLSSSDGSAAPARIESAMSALEAGRTVFADGWDAPDVREPDLVFLFGRTLQGPLVGWRWPQVTAERIVPMPQGHEGIVGAALWTGLASRRFYGSCACIVDSCA